MTRAECYRFASTVAKSLGYKPCGTGAQTLFAALVGETDPSMKETASVAKRQPETYAVARAANPGTADTSRKGFDLHPATARPR